MNEQQDEYEISMSPTERRAAINSLLPPPVRDKVHLAVGLERLRQMDKWSAEHDSHHEPYEWLGLITQYAAQGRYIEAAALCEAAEERLRATEDLQVQP